MLNNLQSSNPTKINSLRTKIVNILSSITSPSLHTSKESYRFQNKETLLSIKIKMNHRNSNSNRRNQVYYSFQKNYKDQAYQINFLDKIVTIKI
ncbi:unnamed protein product [Paramecium sonneborni]|uniref:Uncharacterized protein n=1 Tax=Paramecium sonneborni TaxID=65129 RepID=A0A8S1RQS3_9CILI|nr:unnamed protein product [Paramecium sonneborni]